MLPLFVDKTTEREVVDHLLSIGKELDDNCRFGNRRDESIRSDGFFSDMLEEKP